MCTPAKRLATGVDVLDLSQKNCSPGPTEVNSTSQDVIILSEDEDKTTPTTSDTEKENAPFRKNGTNGKALLIYLENELRQEETTLLLLQKLRESQISNFTQTNNSSKTTFPAASSPVSQQNNGHVNSVSSGSPAQSTNRSTPVSQIPKTVPQSLPQSNSPIAAPKVTKTAALQSLEQQCNAKKSVLRKQLERNLDKINLPRPTAATGLCEVSFIPSALTAEFTSLLGLEEVVRTIQDFDPSAQGKQPEPRRSFDPFVCIKCGTDFTPVWKRERPGSTSVICESCLTNTQRSSLQKEYEESVQQVLQQHLVSEREVEHEYQDIVTNSTKLEAFIKEQEKKLLAAHQSQLTQQQLAQQQAAAHTARYNSKQSGVNNIRSHPNNPVSSVTAHQRSRTGVATPTHSGSTSSAATTAVTATTATQQFAQQYQQQLAKAAAAANGTVGASLNPATFMMAAAANTQQQQQQRIAAAVISNLQPQQQQAQAQQFQTNPDLVAQAVIMSNICGGGANNPTTNTRLLEQAVQYIRFLQQQQQQAAIVSQLLNTFQSNPAAYLSLLQQLWGGASAPNNASAQHNNNNTAKK